ncbi:hypothetical protein [Paenibacillus pabuli]|nr:hypothetical protein [Paenibacillus pabuli]
MVSVKIQQALKYSEAASSAERMDDVFGQLRNSGLPEPVFNFILNTKES